MRCRRDCRHRRHHHRYGDSNNIHNYVLKIRFFFHFIALRCCSIVLVCVLVESDFTVRARLSHCLSRSGSY